MKRIISFVLSAALILSAMFITPSYASAYDGVADTAAVRQAVQMFNPSPDMAVYSDDFFRGNSLEYNASLSTWSFVICNTTPDDFVRDRTDRSGMLRTHLEDNGFVDFEVNDDFCTEPSAETSAVGCAHKKITDNGKDYTLLAIIPRSGTAGAEFARSIRESDSPDDRGDHAGYRAAAGKISDYVTDYINAHGIKGDIKIWITGYSGGAGIADIFCADLLRNPSKILGGGIVFRPEDFYAYIFSPLKVAADEDRPSSEDFRYIHVIYDRADLLAVAPFATGFGRYGTEYHFSEYADRDRMLELLKTDDKNLYESYIADRDPDGFTPYRIDISQIIKGKIKVVPDPDSYIPNDQAAYLEAVAGALKELSANSSEDGDARKGYYKVYQGAVEHFMAGTATKRMDILKSAIAETKTSIPMLITMYMTSLVERGKAYDSDVIRDSFENAFNYIASQLENADGSIKKEYRLTMNAYKIIRRSLFEKSEEGSYALKDNVDLAKLSILLPTMKKLSAKLYAATLETALRNNGTDEKTVEVLTSDADSEAITELARTLLLVDTLQSRRAEPFSFNNEQFRHLATLYGNMNRYLSAHMYRFVIEWLRAADPYYDDYEPLNDAQKTGYRRVYIDARGGAVTASVTDQDGKTAAVFRNGRIISRNDEWIGYTACDEGGWLRLPLDKEYKVCIDSGGKTVRVIAAEFSIRDGREVKFVSFGKRKGGGILVLPASKPEEGAYSLPSSVNYRMYMKEKLKSSLPKVRSFAVKAGKKTFTARWKKLTGKKAAAADNIELQYSTDSSFRTSKIVTRNLAKSRSSVKVRELKKGKICYVRIRTVKYKSGTKYVSGWSSVKKIKIG